MHVFVKLMPRGEERIIKCQYEWEKNIPKPQEKVPPSASSKTFETSKIDVLKENQDDGPASKEVKPDNITL